MGNRGWRGGLGSWWEGVGVLSLVMGAHSIAISSTGIRAKVEMDSLNRTG